MDHPRALVPSLARRWASALWLDLDIGEKLQVAAVRQAVVKAMAAGEERNCLVTQLTHGPLREKLVSNLVLNIRSGLVASTSGNGTSQEFATRLELRWGGSFQHEELVLSERSLEYA